MKVVRRILILCFGCLCVSLSMAQDTNTLRIAAGWTGAEQAGFQTVIDMFEDQTGIEVIYEEDTNLVENVVKSGFLEDPADIAFLPRPGVIRQLAEDQQLIRLDDPDDPILELALLRNTLGDSFLRLGMFEDAVYGLMVTSGSKSTIWYNIDTFEEYDISPPTAWTELLEIIEMLAADGVTPFTLGGGDGWPLSDWFENVFIRLHGRQVYNELFVEQSISWEDPRVSEAFSVMSEMLLPYDERVVDGEEAILEVSHRDAVESWLSGEAPMYYEGGFVRSHAQEAFPDLVCGEDYSFFTFPQINPSYGRPIVGGGQLAVVFTDNEAVREFMNFIASPEAATAWVTAETGGIISPNLGVDIDVYTDVCAQLEAEQIRNANAFAFDGSDLMSGIFGEFAFFTALQDYLLDPGALGNILDYLNDAASKS